MTRIGVPPRSVKPVTELYGELLLEAGRPDEALERFQEGLTLHRRRALLLGGAARASAELGRTDLADRYRSELRDVWSGWDTEHPLAREVRGNR